MPTMTGKQWLQARLMVPANEGMTAVFCKEYTNFLSFDKKISQQPTAGEFCRGDRRSPLAAKAVFFGSVSLIVCLIRGPIGLIGPIGPIRLFDQSDPSDPSDQSVDGRREQPNAIFER